MNIKILLGKYRNTALSTREQGDRFERLMQAYLLTDPRYAALFEKVWIWKEFPGRKSLGGPDAGIDLVALTHAGEYWAVQCKFFDPSQTIQKSQVDTFLATSSREFQIPRKGSFFFSCRLWISTTNRWSSQAAEALQNQHPPVLRINLFDLEQSPVDWEKLNQGIYGEKARKEGKTLLPHQKDAVDKAHEYFKTRDRGKLIMACGTGKRRIKRAASGTTPTTGPGNRRSPGTSWTFFFR